MVVFVQGYSISYFLSVEHCNNYKLIFGMFQGNYLDCEYDNNEHEKTDGGLGAGAPMFLSEVIHGTACSIL